MRVCRTDAGLLKIHYYCGSLSYNRCRIWNPTEQVPTARTALEGSIIKATSQCVSVLVEFVCDAAGCSHESTVIKKAVIRPSRVDEPGRDLAISRMALFRHFVGGKTVWCIICESLEEYFKYKPQPLSFSSIVLSFCLGLDFVFGPLRRQPQEPCIRIRWPCNAHCLK